MIYNNKLQIAKELDSLSNNAEDGDKSASNDQNQKPEELAVDGQCLISEQDYVNERGIRFTPQMQEEVSLSPYGLACVRELLRFLISLCNPRDKQNTDVMIHLGLTLLTVAFEVSADNIGKYATLLALVKDDLCRNLFSVSIMYKLYLYSNLRVFFSYNYLNCYQMTFTKVIRKVFGLIKKTHFQSLCLKKLHEVA